MDDIYQRALPDAFSRPIGAMAITVLWLAREVRQLPADRTRAQPVPDQPCRPDRPPPDAGGPAPVHRAGWMRLRNDRPAGEYHQARALRKMGYPRMELQGKIARLSVRRILFA